MADRNNKNADIVAVANQAGVSISTVSRSFNHPHLVKPATRKKIDRAIRKLGYIRNRAAQTMHGIRSGTIGLVVPTIDNAIFAEVIQAFSDAVDAHGFTILVATHNYSLEREYAVLRKLLEHRVDGVALIGLDHNEETFGLIEHQDIPAITIWNYDPDARLSCVGADNHEAGRLAAEHLTSLGHRDIAMVFPPLQGNDRAQARFDGALSVLQVKEDDRAQPRKTEARYSISDGKEAVIELLESATRPTALLCGNDILATGAIHAARKLGLEVPRDLSVMGIGDFKGSKEMEPALTTIAFPARDIGKIAGNQLAHSIMTETRDINRIKCPIELAPRDTCVTLEC